MLGLSYRLCHLCVLSLVAILVQTGCGGEDPPAQPQPGNTTGSTMPGTDGTDPQNPNDPSCVGIAGHLHPTKARALYDSLPADQQQKLRTAISTQDPNLFGDDETFVSYLESRNLITVPISAPAAGCSSTNTQLFVAHTFETTGGDGADPLITTPCLGLAQNPAPEFWHCATDAAVDAFNQKNCIDPAFKGLGCAPLNPAGLTLVIDQNPCFEKAKAANQPIHATTKTTLAGLGLNQTLTEKPYDITKCLGESGQTWLVGAQEMVDNAGQPVTCHGFTTLPSSDKLECFEIVPEANPSIPEVCGSRWVCLSL